MDDKRSQQRSISDYALLTSAVNNFTRIGQYFNYQIILLLCKHNLMGEVGKYLHVSWFKMMKLYHFLISISWFEEIIPDTLRANIPCSLLFFVIIASFLIIIKIFQCTKPGIITWLMQAYKSTFVRELQQIYRILNEFACIIPLRELLGQ